MIPPLAEGGLPGSTVSHPSDVEYVVGISGTESSWSLVFLCGIDLNLPTSTTSRGVLPGIRACSSIVGLVGPASPFPGLEHVDRVVCNLGCRHDERNLNVKQGDGRCSDGSVGNATSASRTDPTADPWTLLQGKTVDGQEAFCLSALSISSFFWGSGGVGGWKENAWRSVSDLGLAHLNPNLFPFLFVHPPTHATVHSGNPRFERPSAPRLHQVSSLRPYGQHLTRHRAPSMRVMPSCRRRESI